MGEDEQVVRISCRKFSESRGVMYTLIFSWRKSKGIASAGGAKACLVIFKRLVAPWVVVWIEKNAVLTFVGQLKRK
jgi:hypothetical protein